MNVELAEQLRINLDLRHILSYETKHFQEDGEYSTGRAIPSKFQTEKRFKKETVEVCL